MPPSEAFDVRQGVGSGNGPAERQSHHVEKLAPRPSDRQPTSLEESLLKRNDW